MSIHWYPGHMYKATKEIRSALSHIDVVIEVLDARLPYSSSNPVIHALAAEKKHIKILNKIDLADPALTQHWVTYFEQQGVSHTLAVSAKETPHTVKSLHEIVRKITANTITDVRNVDAMIMGIPNVGKSTIINILAERQAAATGNEPAVTKAQKRINCRNGIVLFDTPGILWPKIHNQNSSYRLATTGAIKNTAMQYDDVAYFAVDYLLKAYPELLKSRYHLETLPDTEHEFLVQIARDRGCLVKGGGVNIQRISKIFITELREGVIGPVSLETPEIAQVEMLQVQEVIAKKEAEKKARKQKFKKNQ